MLMLKLKWVNSSRTGRGTIGYNRGELLEEWHSPGYIEKEDPMEMDSTDINLSSLSTMPSSPKSAPNLPSRCNSEPITHHQNGNAQVGELLEDWPRRMSCCSANTEDRQSPCKQLQAKVTFSERSSMHVYCPDPLYVRNKSYTKTDRKNFGSEALSEVIRIKRLILTTPGASAKDSFKCLLKNNIISLEEVVGIEHLVLSKSASKLLKERQDHAREVLMEQRRQRRVEKMQDDHTEKLGDSSEPITHHHNGNAQVGELLEDWPRRMSCCSADTEGWKSLCKQLPPKVTFSERSSMLVYSLDPLYVRNKSYTKTERKNFGSEALSEAIRIERLIMTTPGASTKDSFNCLLKNDIISLAEIVGIEHLVLGKSKAKKLLTERQDHSREVLMEQRRQRHVEKMQYDHIEKLGEFSASRSVKSAKRARIRAAVAA
eukprot:CAMPEP_0202029574 /NCGR_PEP_ID=MMETSP0905-20130828/64048_1 /ASSEMBLY_ACC=CAM_ASM_000554 /TAXON_ID=420261 /ORGANISM="Thalassiosira antarctica, Strain CCMP982" /LENGTH=429 /DNA_ID=CAMNT_0048593341 /DNA_START=550 /DNA_END=1840 /DNA_ORIENTATION=-